MEPIYIPHLLQRPNQTLTLTVDTHLPDLDTLTPVRGQITLIHHHTYLEVKGEAETIVTLTCDRCLQNYNYRVSINPQELIWLQPDPDPDTLPLEREVSLDDLVETLPPQGHFNPSTWLYEQICLALPQRQICNPDCTGIELPAPDNDRAEAESIDRRWSVLSQLQRQLHPPEA
ncbi:MAG TPA: DUF177 domain-containing protein [Leptolyngbyaceae cyanobacterium M65_K2018_010]|nr:DUF177 domain-containing protein [Leptolyngbyaceae cyanobacterium M65_K2018_010]